MLYVLRFDLKTVFNKIMKRFVFQNAVHALQICVLLVRTLLVDTFLQNYMEG